VEIAKTQNSKNVRKFDRKNYCPFCAKGVAKLSRHLILKHSQESEVAPIRALPLGSSKRKLLFQQLLHRGNYMHNMQVLKDKSGQIVPCHRPSASVAVDKFVPCEYCLAFYDRRRLWKHRKACKFKPSPDTGAANTVCHRAQARAGLLLPISSEASDGFIRDILGAMNQGVVTSLIRTDDLIVQFGSRLYAKSGNRQRCWQRIREQLRRLGRLLLAVKELDNTVTCLSDSITPTKFSTLVTAVRTVCGFNYELRSYRVPYLALQLGKSLRHCAKILLSNAIAVDAESTQPQMRTFQQFIHLCETEWSNDSSSNARCSVNKKPKLVPLARNVRKLQEHLLFKVENCQEQLTQSVDTNAWHELCQLTLAQAVLFNGGRAAAVQRLQLSAFLQSQDAALALVENLDQGLTKVELALCQIVMRVDVEGKSGGMVPILLTECVLVQIRRLVETRTSAGVPEGNNFVFARPDSLHPYSGSECLKKYAKQCGAKNMHTLMTGGLRRHIATISQLLALNGNEISMLGSFLGHSIEEFSRFPHDTLHVVKLSKDLLEMEKRSDTNMIGNTLDATDFEMHGKILAI